LQQPVRVGLWLLDNAEPTSLICSCHDSIPRQAYEAF
jgi:hypothetical protein